jgi:dTMP kinase
MRMNTKKGLFITFEGIDGAGKSTHIASLAGLLETQDQVVTRSREPGGTPLAESLRLLVLNESMDSMTEALLVFAARRDHIQNVIVPSLNRGEVVLCDRFTDASFAYQGAGKGFDTSVLDALEQWVQDGLQPDLTIWFDLPAPIAAQRLALARNPDRFESQPVAFFERVAAGYAQRMQRSPHRFVRIDADQTPEKVWMDLTNALKVRDILQ